MYSYRSLEVHVLYRTDKSLTEIKEVIREKIKITYQRQRGHYGAFFQTLKELQRIDVILHNVRLAYCEAD